MPRRKEGVLKQEEIPFTGKFPHRWAQGGLQSLRKLGKAGIWRAKNRESCTSQPINSSQTKFPEGRLGQPRVGRHTHLSSTHNLHGTEDRPGEPKEEHLSPMTKKMDLRN